MYAAGDTDADKREYDCLSTRPPFFHLFICGKPKTSKWIKYYSLIVRVRVRMPGWVLLVQTDSQTDLSNERTDILYLWALYFYAIHSPDNRRIYVHIQSPIIF